MCNTSSKQLSWERIVLMCVSFCIKPAPSHEGVLRTVPKQYVCTEGRLMHDSDIDVKDGTDVLLLCLVVVPSPASREAPERIYAAPRGRAQVRWKKERPLATTGWRARADGTREEIHFYGGEWGWLSDSELSEARQKWPRTAP